MKLEAGLYIDNDIIEIGEPTRFERCHFFGCEFVGSAHRVEFDQCVFEQCVDHPHPIAAGFSGGFHSLSISRCLFYGHPSETEPALVAELVPA